MSKITVTVTFTEKELKELLIDGLEGLKVTDKVKMKKIFNSKSFAKDLAEDLKYIWTQNLQDEASYELLECMGLEECCEDTTQWNT